MSDPIRIFVGCSSGDDLESQAVLEYSLRMHCAEEIEIVWMQLSRDPASPFFSDGSRGWQTKRWSTPFSGFRWLVPSLCDYRGRAIYLDSDMIAMADISELWGQKIGSGKCVIAKAGVDAWRFCVSVWDCAAARLHVLPALELRQSDAHQYMISRFRNSTLVEPFIGNWNCIDGENYKDLFDPDIKLIHYSDESAQPHLKYAIERLAGEMRSHWFDGKVRRHWRPELIKLFDSLLEQAIAAGYPPEKYRPAEPFGPYSIANHANYVGHKWGKGK